MRLVIYDRLLRAPTSLFNEKSLCMIARNMLTTGRLDDEGCDAWNSNEFVARARDALGSPVRILTGEKKHGLRRKASARQSLRPMALSRILARRI